MNKAKSTKRPIILKNALYQILLKLIPPEEYSPHLEDIVNALNDETSYKISEMKQQETKKAASSI